MKLNSSQALKEMLDACMAMVQVSQVTVLVRLSGFSSASIFHTINTPNHVDITTLVGWA